MIAVKLSANGGIFELSYKNEKEYAESILSAMTGISIERLVDGDDLAVFEINLLSDAAEALKLTPMWLVECKPRTKPKLELVE